MNQQSIRQQRRNDNSINTEDTDSEEAFTANSNQRHIGKFGHDFFCF